MKTDSAADPLAETEAALEAALRPLGDNALSELFKERVIPPALAKALIQAQIAAKGVPKDGRNTHSGYDYTKADTIVDAAKRALNGAGLGVLPLNLDQERFEVGPKDVVNYDLIRELVLFHESGVSVAFTVKWPLYLQSGKRARDKAVGAADTTLMGYIYRDLCAIPRGLPETEMDDRNDEGTSEPGQVATPPKASPKPAKPVAKPKDTIKPKLPAKAAAKPPTKPAKGKAAAKAKPKAKPPAKDKAEDDADDAGDETVEATPSDAAEGELSKPGKTEVGQVYGEKKEEVEGEQFDALSETEQNRQIALALRQGITPLTANGKLLPGLVAMLPVDPSADDLEGAGWEKAIAQELEDLAGADPVARKTVNAVTRLATTKLGLKAKAAKTRFVQAFEFMGVDVAGKQPPNGYQLRCFAIAVIQADETAEATA